MEAAGLGARMRGLRGRPVARAGALSLVAFATAAAGAGVARAIATSYLPVALERIRSAPDLIGAVMTVNPVAGFLVPLVVGAWSDRLARRGRPRRTAFILFGALMAAGGLVAVALGSGTTYLVLAGAGALAYVGINAVTTAHRALVPLLFDDERRPRGTSALEVSLLAGSLAGIAAGGWLIERATWLPFAVAAAALPLMALPTLLRVREPDEEAVEGGGRLPIGAYLHAARQPLVRWFVAGELLWVLGYAALPPFFILYAGEVLGLPPFRASLWLAAFGVVVGLAMLVGGRARARGRQLALLLAGVALMGAGFAGVAATDDLATVAIALGPAAVGYGLASAVAFPVLTLFADEGEEGSFSAVYTSTRSLAGIVGIPLAGWVVDATGSYRSLFVLAAVGALSALAPLAAVARRAP